MGNAETEKRQVRSLTSFCSFSLFLLSFSSLKAMSLAFFLSSSAFLSAMVNVWPGMAKDLWRNGGQGVAVQGGGARLTHSSLLPRPTGKGPPLAAT